MQAVRFSLVIAAIGVITAIDFRLHVNPTTVALTFLVAVLLVSAYWGLRYAVVLALGATAAFNFYFLPPILTFTIADPQNWVALFAFVVAALVASNLAERARHNAEAAKQRRREVELLYDFSQRLLASENELELLNALPLYVQETFSIRSVSMMVADHPSVYRSSPDAEVDESLLRLTLLRGEPNSAYRNRVRTSAPGCAHRRSASVTGYNLSRETLDAIGGLAGLSIERVRALEALSKNQAMQENERLRSALLDSVTHEFRTPLTAIKANVTTLLSGATLDDHSKRELLTAIDKETDKLNRLVGEAAEMGHLDAGRFKLDLHLHSIQEALQPALEDAKASIENHPMEIQVPSDLPQVRMDIQRIREVLMHLLDNAGKYSGPGTPIKVTAEVESDRVVISVADRGIGIGSLEQALIFDKFYRGGRQRYTAPGAGMGLPIAKAIMEAHGGTIGVVSQLGTVRSSPSACRFTTI